ncbi:MAG: hypothetical protein PHV37_06800 [Candidatus Gastranaerophilales bacterium]|nr:hypothetical protein [Candidatus Gastranaerophilales bacterium]
MKISSAQKDTLELTKKENTKVDEECISPCDLSFKDIVNRSQSIANDDILASASLKDDLMSVLSDIKTDFNYDTVNMDKDDAKFFIDMVHDGQFALNVQGDVNATLVNMTDTAASSIVKTSTVSKALMSMLEDSYNTQKPVRIDFDNNVSVIMKIDKEGKLSANFIPGDKAVEQYLRDNIGFLKQRFDEQNLAYGNLSYSQHKNSRQNKKDNENKQGE